VANAHSGSLTFTVPDWRLYHERVSLHEPGLCHWIYRALLYPGEVYFHLVDLSLFTAA